MSQKARTIVMEWTVKGHPTQSRTLNTDATELQLVESLLTRHWPEGDDRPIRIVFYETRDGQKVKTNHYDSRTRQFI